VSNFSPAHVEAVMKVGPSLAVNECGMSLKNHDGATISWCERHNVTCEAYDAMKGCDFSSPVIKTVAAVH
jgi:diketogulonate reductase-like aldo/keto reductase